MNVDELTGTDLNKAVAECLGIRHTRFQGQVIDQGCNPLMYDNDWSIAGEIIEREGMGVWAYQWNEKGEPEQGWYAEDRDGNHVQTGATPLIAAMRCYVASKLGGEVELPEEITK